MLAEEMKLIWAAEPKNYTGAAVTKKYVNMGNYGKLTIMIQTGAWAAGTAAVTIKQTTDGVSAGVKAVSFAWQHNDEATSGTLVKTAVTSDTFNLTTALKLYVIEIQASDLDTNNGFKYASIDIASPGSNADFYGVTYLLSEPRYAQGTPPSIA